MGRSLVLMFVGLLSASALAASPSGDVQAPSIAWTQATPQPADSTACVSGTRPTLTRSVAVGPDGNPVFVGDVPFSSTTVVVAKYDRASGERLWCTSFPVRATAGGAPFTVAFAQ